MSLNNKSRWENAYIAEPKFYTDRDGKTFGAFALTENTVSAFPIEPEKKYSVDGKSVNNWKMIIISMTTNSVLLETDYFKTLKLLNQQYQLDKNENFILVEGIPLSELKLFSK